MSDVQKPKESDKDVRPNKDHTSDVDIMEDDQQTNELETKEQNLVETDRTYTPPPITEPPGEDNPTYNYPATETDPKP